VQSEERLADDMQYKIFVAKYFEKYLRWKFCGVACSHVSM